MARNNTVAVIDFGSSTINVIIADRGVNNTFNIYGKSEMEYSGYLDGELLNSSELFNVLGHAISTAESTHKSKITEVYVGVPGEFTSVVIKEPTISFETKRKISSTEIDELFDKGNVFKNHPDFLLINQSPIFYTTDSGRLLINPKDEKTSKLSGQLSYVLAKRSFTDIISQVLMQLGIKTVEFVSSCLAESVYLLDSYSRDRYAVLIDIGYTTSSVMVVRGEGLLFLKSFPIGGAHISADLFECFKVPFHIAEELKRKVSLTFSVTKNDEYEIISKEKTYKFNAEETHGIIEARLDAIAKLINKCLKLCEMEYPSYTNYKLTGGGISYIRGAKDYLGRSIGKNIDLARNSIPQLDYPHMSSTYALLDLALKQHKNNNNVFDRLFK